MVLSVKLEKLIITEILLKKTRTKGISSNTFKSAFDDGEKYELTELGQNFVHYTMNELTNKIE